MREAITPGKLYVAMSAEFRRLTAAQCGWCKMPLLKMVEKPAAGEPNWTLESADNACPRCAPVIQQLRERFAREYDVWPVFADSSFGAKTPAR